jgi:integrase
MKSTMVKYGKRFNVVKELEPGFKTKDKKIIKDFLIFCGGTAGKSTLSKYHRFMVKICDTLEGDLDKIDLQRMRAFLKIVNESDMLPATKNDVRKIFKRFLKEHYDDWSLRFKNLEDPSLKCIKEINQDKINANTILSSGERKRLFDGITNLKYRAATILLYECGGRPEEVLKLKFKDIDLIGGDVKLKSSKTGNLRINPIRDSIVHMKRWKQEYPFPNVMADDYVFPSQKGRNNHQSVSAYGMFLKKVGRKILGRDIFPYLLRHTRATELQKVLPAKIYEKFMDHSIETATRYSHLDKDDVRKVMFNNVYKIDEIEENNKSKLEGEVKFLKNKINSMDKKLKNIGKFGIIANSIFEDKKIQKEILEIMIKNGYGKQLIKIAGK